MTPYKLVELRNGLQITLYPIGTATFRSTAHTNIYWTEDGAAHLWNSGLAISSYDVEIWDVKPQEITDFPAAPLTAKHPFEAPPPPPAQRARVDDAEAEAMGRAFRLAASLLANIQAHKSEGSPVVSMAVLDITRALAMLVVWGYEAPQEWLKIRDAADLALYDVEHVKDKA